MKTCTTDTNCPSGSTCSVDLTGGQKVCAVTCGTTSSPDDSVCPADTSCAYNLDQTTLFCGPT
jgi:hypothetical protein